LVTDDLDAKESFKHTILTHTKNIVRRGFKEGETLEVLSYHSPSHLPTEG
jgi:hypothetical protein